MPLRGCQIGTEIASKGGQDCQMGAKIANLANLDHVLGILLFLLQDCQLFQDCQLPPPGAEPGRKRGTGGRGRVFDAPVRRQQP